MTKEDILKERELAASEEKQQLQIYSRWVQYRQEEFEHADIQLNAQTSQNLDDLIYIQDIIAEWSSKASEKSKPTFNKVAGALIRISAYLVTVESTAKALVCDLAREGRVTSNVMKENDKLKTELSNKDLKHGLELGKMQKEIELLKQQLAFHEQK